LQDGDEPHAVTLIPLNGRTNKGAPYLAKAISGTLLLEKLPRDDFLVGWLFCSQVKGGTLNYIFSEELP